MEAYSLPSTWLETIGERRQNEPGPSVLRVWCLGVLGWVWGGPLASIVWSGHGLGAANLLGPLIPGQLVV